MRSYCIAQGTIHTFLRKTIMEDNIRKGICECVCVCVCVCVYWVTLLYGRNWHNTINQLYFNKRYLNLQKVARSVQ